jgi:hypothetical protein
VGWCALAAKPWCSFAVNRWCTSSRKLTTVARGVSKLMNAQMVSVRLGVVIALTVV